MLRGRLLLCSGPHDLTGVTLVAFLLAALVTGVHFYALLLVLLSPVVLRVWDRRRRLS